MGSINIGYNLLQLNHYALRSVDSFLIKKDRGRANHMSHTIGVKYWKTHNRGGVADTSVSRYDAASQEWRARLAGVGRAQSPVEVQIGSSDGTALDGILSERDIVRELGKRGAPCLSDKVSDLMTAKLITCTPDDQADAVLEKMTAGRFRHMPVIEDGKMIGLISIGAVLTIVKESAVDLFILVRNESCQPILVCNSDPSTCRRNFYFLVFLKI